MQTARLTMIVLPVARIWYARVNRAALTRTNTVSPLERGLWGWLDLSWKISSLGARIMAGNDLILEPLKYRICRIR